MMPMALIYISLYSLSGAKVGVDLPPLLDLDAEAVQYHRDLGILADGEHQVHPALVAERGERGPGRVGDEMICGQFVRSEAHTSELQSLMRTLYAVFCLKKKKNTHEQQIKISKKLNTNNSYILMQSNMKHNITKQQKTEIELR